MLAEVILEVFRIALPQIFARVVLVCAVVTAALIRLLG